MGITRADAVKLIETQMHWDGQKTDKGGRYSYGLVELRELLDAIYGGPPATSDEKLCRHEGRSEPPPLETREEAIEKAFREGGSRGAMLIYTSDFGDELLGSFDEDGKFIKA